ncbi:hypothetical protein [Dactylosporangium sp. CA-139066]
MSEIVVASTEAHPGGDDLAPQSLAELAQNYAAVDELPSAVAFGERAL